MCIMNILTLYIEEFLTAPYIILGRITSACLGTRLVSILDFSVSETALILWKGAVSLRENLIWVTKVILDYFFFFTLLWDWSKITPPFKPIRCKVKPIPIWSLAFSYASSRFQFALVYKLIISENLKSHYQNHDHIGQHHESLGSACICPYEFAQALIFNLFRWFYQPIKYYIRLDRSIWQPFNWTRVRTAANEITSMEYSTAHAQVTYGKSV